MHYQELKPVSEGKRKYRFITTGVNSCKLVGRLARHRNCNFYSSDGILRAWIRKGVLYCSENYAWNGCSPKRYIGTDDFGIWIGTPDFEKTLLASLMHDILFQFAEVGKYDMHDCNYQFLTLMEKENFRLAQHYYEAVEMFGEKYYGHDGAGVRIKFLY